MTSRSPDKSRPGDDPGNSTLSKSELKRQATHLQDLGRRLAALNSRILAEIDLPPGVRDAVTDYQRFSSHGARRRQLQFIGKLMRDVDVEPINATLDRLDGTSAAARYEFHQLEVWRKRLLEDTQALTDYLAEHPTTDRQRLRQHIRNVHKAKDETAKKTASRALFRLLRESG